MKKVAKKMLALLLVAVICLSAFGFAVMAEEEKKDEEKPELSGEISFCTWGSQEEIETNKKVIEAFEKKYPGTKVNLEVFNDAYNETVETRYLGGQCPDVIYGHPRTFLPWADAGMLMDLSELYEEHEEWFNEEEWMTSLYDWYKIDGKYYATVNGADVFVLYYNKSMCDEVGVDYPAENWSWDQLNEWASALTERLDEETPIRWGMNTDEGWYMNFFPYLYARGGSVFDNMLNPTKVTFYSEAAVDAIQFYSDRIHKYKNTPDGADWEFIAGGFNGEQFGSYVSGVWDTVFLSGIEDFEWDITLLPQNEKSINTALYAGYAVCSQTKNPELAKAFAAFMMTEEGQSILASTGLITVANKKVATSDEILKFEGAPENNIIRVTALENAVNVDANLYCWDEMVNVIAAEMSKVYQEDPISAEECAQNIQKQLEKLLEKELADRKDTKEKKEEKSADEEKAEDEMKEEETTEESK